MTTGQNSTHYLKYCFHVSVIQVSAGVLPASRPSHHGPEVRLPGLFRTVRHPAQVSPAQVHRSLAEGCQETKRGRSGTFFGRSLFTACGIIISESSEAPNPEGLLKYQLVLNFVQGQDGFINI